MRWSSPPGSGALLPDLSGLREAAPWTNREAAAARAVPGPARGHRRFMVASEMATAFAALGSSVTMPARDGVLPLAEPFAGERITESLREAGASVRIGVAVRPRLRQPARAADPRAKGEAVEDGRWARHVATADELAVPQVTSPNRRSRRWG
jgi:pyruvate/2-oxoglutarate dehydrogenase complex dihydrolipoamide dehydrogenase (E3) component